MKFIPIKLKGAYVIEPDRYNDKRGYFLKVFAGQESKNKGLAEKFVESSLSYNKKRGTLRGLHYQKPPFSEDKLVMCVKGAAFDVIVDLRPKSKTYKKWFGLELSEKNQKQIFVPKGFAHGFITSKNNTQVLYHISQFYNPRAATGVPYNDRQFNIKWPLPVSVISEKDKAWSSYENS